MIGNLPDLFHVIWLVPGIDLWNNFVDWFNQF